MKRLRNFILRGLRNRSSDPIRSAQAPGGACLYLPARGLARRDLAVGGPAGAGPDPAKHAKMENHDESGCDDDGGPFRALPLSSEIGCDAWAFMRPHWVSPRPKPVLLLIFLDTSPDYHRRSDVDLAYFQAR